MGEIVMLVGLLMPFAHLSHEEAKTVLENHKVEMVSEHASIKEVLLRWGKPSHIEKGTNFYSRKNYVMFYYTSGPCAYETRSCSVVFEGGQIARLDDIKPEFINYTL